MPWMACFPVCGGEPKFGIRSNVRVTYLVYKQSRTLRSVSRCLVRGSQDDHLPPLLLIRSQRTLRAG